MSSLRDADKVISKLKENALKDIKLFINRARGDMILDKEMLDSKKIEDLLNVEVSGVIPEDDNITTFLGAGKTVNRLCESFSSFNLLAKNVLGETTALYDCTEKYKGFFGFFKRILKKKV